MGSARLTVYLGCYVERKGLGALPQLGDNLKLHVRCRVATITSRPCQERLLPLGSGSSCSPRASPARHHAGREAYESGTLRPLPQASRPRKSAREDRPMTSFIGAEIASHHLIP